MFFFFPVNTDAPIYHFPWATIGVIVANTGLFAACVVHPEIWETGILRFADGLHPMQWISSAFLHADIFHLIGNLLFLWGFGLVVEGKLGWWRFTLLYLAIALVSGLIVQVVMLSYAGESSGALGASGVIFGLLAISLIWAPRNEMSVFYFLFIFFLLRSGAIEITILTFGGYFLAWQVLLAAFSGFSIGSEMLHLLGASVGAAAGVALLKWELVDCEGWDLFHVIKNTHGRRDDEFHYRTAGLTIQPIATPREMPTDAAPAAPRERVKASALDPADRLRRFLEAGDFISASGEYDKLQAFHASRPVAPPTLLQLGEGLLRSDMGEDAGPVLEAFLATAPADDPAAPRVRLKLARLCLDELDHPGRARQLLAEIDPTTLPPKAAAAYRALRERAG